MPAWLARILCKAIGCNWWKDATIPSGVMRRRECARCGANDWTLT